jgi:hypothetical protein
MVGRSLALWSPQPDTASWVVLSNVLGSAEGGGTTGAAKEEKESAHGVWTKSKLALLGEGLPLGDEAHG